MSKQVTENKALPLINWLTEKAIEGAPPLSSAEDLAQEYLIDQSYPDDEERIESLINWGRPPRILLQALSLVLAVF